MEFSLNGQDYIQLNNLLKVMQWAESGGQANQMILDGMVKVNGETALEKRKKIRANDTVAFEDHEVRITNQQS